MACQLTRGINELFTGGQLYFVLSKLANCYDVPGVINVVWHNGGLVFKERAALKQAPVQCGVCVCVCLLLPSQTKANLHEPA